jgi:hypothetical protein
MPGSLRCDSETVRAGFLPSRERGGDCGSKGVWGLPGTAEGTNPPKRVVIDGLAFRRTGGDRWTHLPPITVAVQWGYVAASARKDVA